MMVGQVGDLQGAAQAINKGGTAIAAGTNYAQTDITLESMNYLVAGVVGQI